MVVTRLRGLIPLFIRRVRLHQRRDRAVIVEARLDGQRAGPGSGGAAERGWIGHPHPPVAVGGNAQHDLARRHAARNVAAHGLIHVVAHTRVACAAEQRGVVPGLTLDPPTVEVVGHQIEEIQLRSQRREVDPLEFVEPRGCRRGDLVALSVGRRLRVELRPDRRREQRVVLRILRTHIRIHPRRHHGVFPIEVHAIEAVAHHECPHALRELLPGRRRRRDVGESPRVEPPAHRDEHAEVRMRRLEPRIGPEMPAHGRAVAVRAHRTLHVRPRINDLDLPRRRNPRERMDHMRQLARRQVRDFVGLLVDAPAREVGHDAAFRRNHRRRGAWRRRRTPTRVTPAAPQALSVELHRRQNRIGGPVRLQSKSHTAPRRDAPVPCLVRERVALPAPALQHGAPVACHRPGQIERQGPAIDRRCAGVGDFHVGDESAVP